MSKEQKASTTSYIRIGGEEDETGQVESDILELDLIFIREKGLSQQFLEITITGHNPQNQSPQSGIKVIQSKESFEKLKNYFNQLNWENL